MHIRQGFICTYALQRILAALEKSPKALSEAYLFAFVTFVVHLSFAQVDLFQAWHSRRAYERARGQVGSCQLHLLTDPDNALAFLHDPPQSSPKARYQRYGKPEYQWGANDCQRRRSRENRELPVTLLLGHLTRAIFRSISCST
jgi:hypothetical protein